jgi:rhodanese-related sulfurtransferase
MSNQECKISRWQELKRQIRNLTPAEFHCKMVESPGAVLIDVRTPPEFESGSLPGAINLNYLDHAFWDRMEEMCPDKTYLVFCRTGRRSIRTCLLMQNGGFREVYNLDGGYVAWLEKMP